MYVLKIYEDPVYINDTYEIDRHLHAISLNQNNSVTRTVNGS